MRKFLATLSLALMAASPALAEKVRLACVLTDTKGRELSYAFIPVSGTLLEEAAMRKDGATVIHSSEKRPTWSATEAADNQLFILTYRPNPQFKIVMENRTKSVQGMRLSSALLVQGSNIIGKGACGFDMSGLDGDGDFPGTAY